MLPGRPTRRSASGSLAPTAAFHKGPQPIRSHMPHQARSHERLLHAEAEIERVLDALHAAAARADGQTYFGLFTPDAVFIGTDVRERWSFPEFRARSEPSLATR